MYENLSIYSTLEVEKQKGVFIIGNWERLKYDLNLHSLTGGKLLSIQLYIEKFNKVCVLTEFRNLTYS